MSELKLVILGTSSGMPTKERGMPGVYLEYNGKGILFDCGEGVQRSMILYGASPMKVRYILITHFHGDHVFGLPPLLHTYNLLGRRKGIYIFAPPSQINRLRRLVFSIPLHLNYPLIWKGAREGIIVQEDEFLLEAVPLKHGVETYGYIFRERDRRKLIKEKIKGIYDWNVLRALKAGKKVEYRGKILDPEEYTYILKGRSVAYITDTSEVVVPDVDILLHDSTFEEEEKELAEEKGHAVMEEVARKSCEKGVTYIVYHISPRYRDVEEIERRVREVCPSARVARDGEVIYVERTKE